MTTRKKKRQDGSGSTGGGFIKKVSSLFNLDSVKNNCCKYSNSNRAHLSIVHAVASVN